MRHFSSLFLVTALWGLPALAATHRTRILVLDFPRAASVDPATLKTLDDYLAGTVRDQGFEVTTPSQVSDVLSLERQRQLLGCSDSGCLAELGGALGVDAIVSPSLAVLDQNVVLTLSATSQKGLSVGSQRKVVKGRALDGILPAVDELAPKLMAQVRSALSPSLVPDAAKAPEPAGGLSARTAPEPSSPVGSYVLLGTGAAALAASAIVGVLANSKAHAYQHGPLSQSERTSDASTAKDLAYGSTALTAAGVALVVTGGILWLTHDSGGAGAAQ